MLPPRGWNLKLPMNTSDISETRNVAANHRGPGTVWAAVALGSYLWILCHLPAGLGASLAVGLSCLVGVAVSGGNLLRGASDFFLAPSAIRRIVLSIIADTRLERDEARFGGKRARAAWITVRGAWSLVAALAVYATIKVLATIWK
jgi:hypothetical protein